MRKFGVFLLAVFMLVGFVGCEDETDKLLLEDEPSLYLIFALGNESFSFENPTMAFLKQNGEEKKKVKLTKSEIDALAELLQKQKMEIQRTASTRLPQRGSLLIESGDGKDGITFYRAPFQESPEEPAYLYIEPWNDVARVDTLRTFRCYENMDLVKEMTRIVFPEELTAGEKEALRSQEAPAKAS